MSAGVLTSQGLYIQTLRKCFDHITTTTEPVVSEMPRMTAITPRVVLLKYCVICMCNHFFCSLFEMHHLLCCNLWMVVLLSLETLQRFAALVLHPRFLLLLFDFKDCLRQQVFLLHSKMVIKDHLVLIMDFMSSNFWLSSSICHELY